MKASGWKTRLVVIIAIAVALRIMAALALGDVAEPLSGAWDQVSYDALAQRLLAGHGFSFALPWYPFTMAGEPTAHWSYLYTTFLAAVYAVFGHHPLAARLFQALMSGLSIALTYRLAVRVSAPFCSLRAAAGPAGGAGSTAKAGGGRSAKYRASTVGLAAAALAACYAYFLFFSAALMTQTFYIMALLAAMTLAVEMPRRSSVARWLALGLALSVGALLRQTLLIFTPVLLAWIWWASRRIAPTPTVASRPSVLLGVAVCLLVIALAVLPWTAYNALVFDDFLLLNSNGGYWLFSSNHPDQGTTFDANFVGKLPDELKGLREPAIDRALYARGLGFILADPIRFVMLSINRIGTYFWVLPAGEAFGLSDLARLVSFGLYLPFMVYGLLVSRRNWRCCLPLYLYVAFDTTLHLATWAAPRYRLPSDALMMVFAGWAVADVAARLRGRLSSSRGHQSNEGEPVLGAGAA